MNQKEYTVETWILYKFNTRSMYKFQYSNSQTVGRVHDTNLPVFCTQTDGQKHVHADEQTGCFQYTPKKTFVLWGSIKKGK